jgi:hypothetical protein
MTKSSDIEQRERRELLGSSGSMTYHSRSLAELQLEQGQSGRFTDKATVIGSKAAVSYPRLPPDNPFSSDISGVEPPIGIDLSYVEPCGTPAEVEASLLRDAASSALSPEDPAVATEVGHSASGRPAPAFGLVSREAGAPSLIRGRRL